MDHCGYERATVDERAKEGAIEGAAAAGLPA